MAFAAVLGATAVVGQSIWLRELSLLWFGSELCWGMTLAAWLLGVSAGAASSGAASARIRPAYLAAVCALGLSATVPAGLWLLRAARSLVGPGAGEFIPLPAMLALTAAAAGLSGLWVGAMFPAGCALARADPRGPALGSTRRTIGIFFVCEALGTLIGGAAFTFWWVERVDAFSLAGGLSAALLLALAAASFRLGGPGGRAARWAGPGVCAAAAGAWIVLTVAGVAASADQASKQRRWADLAAGGRHVAGAESAFARIDLGYWPGQWSLYVNCRPAAAFPNRVAVAPYVHLAAAQCPRLGRVLLIGQATGELADELRGYPGVALEAVELDRKVQEIISAHVAPAPRPPTAYADARHYLKASPRRYDLILLAPADPTSITTARFYTREFFREVRSHLTDEGVLAFSLPGPAETISPQLRDYLGSVYWAAKGVFGEMIWTWGDPTYVFAAGSAGGAAAGGGVLTADPLMLVARHKRHRAGAAGEPPAPEQHWLRSPQPDAWTFDPAFFLSWREDRLHSSRRGWRSSAGPWLGRPPTASTPTPGP